MAIKLVRVRKERRNFNIYVNNVLVEGGFFSRACAELAARRWARELRGLYTRW